MIERVIAIIERETGERVTADTRFDSMKIDSLDFLDLLLQVQAEFGVTIPDAHVAEMNTVGEMTKAIDELHISA